MPSFTERMYEMGCRALEEQERTVSGLRGRAAPLVAAGAVVASLLVPAAWAHAPRGPLTGVLWSCGVLLGSTGGACMVIGVVGLLVPHELGFMLRIGETYGALRELAVVEQPLLDETLARTMDMRLAENDSVVQRLGDWVTWCLVGLASETVGFALATGVVSLHVQ